MKVLFIGLGSIAKKHIHVLRELYSCEIYALRSVKNAKPNTGVVNVDDITEIISEIDFVFLTNPTHLHSKYLDILVEYGKPIFLEKPPSHSLEGIDDLSLKIKESGIITYVGCNLRFHPSIVFLKDNLPGKKINEIDIYSGSYLPDWRDNKDYKNIYSARKDMGGGVHLDLFHEIDYTTWLFGFPKKSSSVLRRVSTLNISSYDYANYILEYDNFIASIVLNYYRHKAKRELELVLETDTLVVDLIKNTIKSDNGTILFEYKDYSIHRTYQSQLKYFTDLLKQDNQPMNSFSESIKNLKICLQHE